MTQRRVMVIGSGGREHALALRLLESPSVGEVVVCPGNPGTAATPKAWAQRGKRLRNVPGDPMQTALGLAGEVDLVVIGPEAPLCAGLTDQLQQRGAVVFGPNRQAARLEGSKAFMKDFAVRHGIRSAKHLVVNGLAELDAALAEFPAPPVVKADGLCAGKGVVVAADHREARAAAAEMLSGARFGAAGETVVLEERVSGFETSVHAIADGKNFVLLPSAQDHKRLLAGDAGPNTGGMGTFAPSPRVGGALLETIRTDIIQRAVEGMAADGCPFTGTLFAGLMIPEHGDPTLLEFNVRFGDPETQVLMGLIDGDFAELLYQAARGSLTPGTAEVSAQHAVCVVLAAAGYPDSPRKGDRITGIPEAEGLDGVRVYHAGTQLQDGELVTAGGRVLGVTAQGVTLEAARQRAYAAAQHIQFKGQQWRADIGALVGS